MKQLIVLLLFVSSIHGQTLRNGKFYCNLDTSDFYEKEEWTLTLFSVNVVELKSVKSNYNRPKRKTEIMKMQKYTGYWTQDLDTILIGLDFYPDSMKFDGDYQLKFILKNNNLILLKAFQIKSFDYSDYFYEQSIWTKQRFRQSRKAKIRAKF